MIHKEENLGEKVFQRGRTEMEQMVKSSYAKAISAPKGRERIEME